MNCKEVQELLPLQIGGDLAETKVKALTAHVGNCSLCAASAIEYREAYRLIRNFEAPSFDDQFYDGIRENVLREIARDSVKPVAWYRANLLPDLFRLRGAWAVATIFLLSLSLLAIYVISKRGERGEEIVIKNGTPDSRSTAPSPSPAKTSDQQSPPVTSIDNLAGNKPSQRRTLPRSRFNGISQRTTQAVQRINKPGPVRNVEASNIAQTVPAVPKIDNGSEDSTNSDTPIRMEMQTNDRNIRIIWFSYQNSKPDFPGKASKGI